MFHRRHFLLTSFVLFSISTFLGIDARLTVGPASREPQGHAGDRRPLRRSAPRSPDDGGFSITLTSPLDRYLLGRRPISIEPVVPKGDEISQVGFFVDGRLLMTALGPPYSFEADFGDEIRRHTVSVKALTRDGRRARVSYVSRSSDLSNGAGRPLEVVPVMVRDAGGRPVRGLTVSDFTLLEDGARQRIVHFDDQPGPASLAVVVSAPSGASSIRDDLLRGAARLSESIPSYHALGLFDTWDSAAARGGDSNRQGSDGEFSYQRSRFLKNLARAEAADSPFHPRALHEILMEAAAALGKRPGGRVLLAFIAQEAPAPPSGAEPSGDDGGESEEAEEEGTEEDVEEKDDPLAAAVEFLKLRRVTIYAVVSGSPEQDGVVPALGEAALETGGEVAFSSTADMMPDASGRISEAMRNQYLLCYLPEDPKREGWRSIELKVRRSDLDVRARTGYALTLPADRGDGEEEN
jgi:hypothetical protein